MSTKYLFRTDDSCIAIKDDRLYVICTKHKDYSPRAVQIIPGFQIELGRNIEDFREALKDTRLPIIIKVLIERGNKATYQIIRMHTGNVDDKVVANIQCTDGKIQTIAFNRALINDKNYRKFNQLSIFHQLAIPCDLCASKCISRTEQVKQVMYAMTMLGNSNIAVTEDGKRLVAKVNIDKQMLIFNFICSGESYILSNISI